VLLNKEHKKTCRYKKPLKTILTYKQTFKNKMVSNNPLPYSTVFEAVFTENAGSSVNYTSRKETREPV
jgi:hypothetical protein